MKYEVITTEEQDIDLAAAADHNKKPAADLIQGLVDGYLSGYASLRVQSKATALKNNIDSAILAKGEAAVEAAIDAVTAAAVEDVKP
jgi:hypothetical protein